MHRILMIILFSMRQRYITKIVSRNRDVEWTNRLKFFQCPLALQKLIIDIDPKSFADLPNRCTVPFPIRYGFEIYRRRLIPLTSTSFARTKSQANRGQCSVFPGRLLRAEMVRHVTVTIKTVWKYGNNSKLKHSLQFILKNIKPKQLTLKKLLKTFPYKQ